jgi:hypothetical protein
MKIYSNGREAICDLHERGYTNDFQLVGNDLLWLQEKFFIRAGEFSITECYRFCNPLQNEPELVVFGVIALFYNAKGILINHYTSYTLTTPPVIEKKLNEMFSCYQENKSR